MISQFISVTEEDEGGLINLTGYSMSKGYQCPNMILKPTLNDKSHKI